MGEPKQNMQTLISQFRKEASSNRDAHPGLRAGFVLANGSMSSNQSGDCPAWSASSKPKAKPQSLARQRDIRRALIEADLVDCMVAFPVLWN